MNHDASRYLSRRTLLARLGAGAAAFALFGTRAAGWAAQATWDPAMELALTFKTNIGGFGRHRNPYVAVWIEDADGNPVRTLALWCDTGRGRRYLEHLSRWFRAIGTGAMGSRVLSQVARPTRVAGTYALVWDGKNDHGQFVALGEYVVNVEMAREHGPYELVRQAVSLGNGPTSATLPGQGELGDVNVEYRSRS